MRSFFVCLTAFLLLISFPACSPSAQRNPFAYAEGGFSVSVRGTYSPAGDTAPRSFSAQITVGVPVGGDLTLRDLTVTFTAPPTLAGVTVSAVHANGTRTVTFSYASDYGNVELPTKSEAFDGFLRFAEALLPLGDVVDISPVTDGIYTVTRKGDGQEAVFTFSEGQVFPLRVAVTSSEEVLTFTVTP